MLGLFALLFSGACIFLGKELLGRLPPITDTVRYLPQAARSVIGSYNLPMLVILILCLLAGNDDFALAIIVGSSICTFLFTLGACAVFFQKHALPVVLRGDLVGVVLAILLAFYFASDGTLSPADGRMLFLWLVFSVCVLYYFSDDKSSLKKLARRETHTKNAGPSRQLLHATQGSFGLLLLVAGAKGLLYSCAVLSTEWNTSEFVLALTLAAFVITLCGFNYTSIAGSSKVPPFGQQTLRGALLTLTGMLGAAAFLSPHGLTVSETLVRFDFPVLLISSAASIPLLTKGEGLQFREGKMLLISYAAYFSFHLMNAQGSTYVWWIALMALFAASLLRRRYSEGRDCSRFA